MSKEISILQSNYIPWKGYFDLIAKSDVFVIYDEVQYTKNDWRNRNKIQSKNGPQWITIPVKQETLNQKIFESKISANNWSKKTCFYFNWKLF
jgi:Holliday junction resolvase-like predicted endonuclease